MMQLKVLVVVVIMAFAPMLASGTVASPKLQEPWELLSNSFNGTAQGISQQNAPSSATAADAAGVTWMTGDNGGAYRSLDCGDTWEPANGGRPPTAGRSGGYLPKIGGVLACGGAGQPSCSHQIPYGLPPSGQPGAQDSISVVTSSPRPVELAPLGGPGLAWHAGTGGTFVSQDQGASWLVANPKCVVAKPYPATAFRHVATDAGDPSHVVVVAGNGKSPGEASTCSLEEPNCRRRQVAWNDKVHEQLATVFSFQQASDTAMHDIDAASAGWHYSSLAHLAIPKLEPSAPGIVGAAGTCANVELPGPLCLADPQFFCHAIKPEAAEPESACLKAKSCACVDTSCRYPNVSRIAIDPRNGWAYASSDAGLLVSYDGGRSWGRNGPADPVPPLRPVSVGGAGYYNTSNVNYLLGPGVKLLTGHTDGCATRPRWRQVRCQQIA